MERSPPFFPAAAATVLPAEVWSGLHLFFLQQQPQSCLLRCGAGSTFSFRATPPATQRSRCGPAAIKRFQPPSETSPALTLWADGLNIPMTPSCWPRLHAALAAFMRPSCGRRRLHAALAAFMQPRRLHAASPPSCGPRRLHVGLAAFMRPSPPSCGRRRLRMATRAAITAPSSQRSRRREAGHPMADALLILVPSLVLAGGSVEEQIDETDELLM